MRIHAGFWVVMGVFLLFIVFEHLGGMQLLYAAEALEEGENLYAVAEELIYWLCQIVYPVFQYC